MRSIKDVFVILILAASSITQASEQIGDAKRNYRNRRQLAEISASKITAGWHTCALASDKSLFCWGGNGEGQLGIGRTSLYELSPLQVVSDPNTTWQLVAAGASTTCGIKSDQSLWCWGFGGEGNIGDGTTESRAVPTAVAGGGSWSTVCVGYNHTCGVKTDGTAYCWGQNQRGEIGDGTTGVRKTNPTAVAGGLKWYSISCDAQSTLGLLANGSGRAWGWNEYYQVGDTTIVDKNKPTAISGNYEWKLLSAGGATSGGITKDGKLLMWGLNEHGQAGDGTVIGRASPKEVFGGGVWRSLSAGAVSCGIKNDGSLLCWGRGESGGIGDGYTIDRLEPTPVSGGGTWVDVSTSYDYTCGVRQDPGQAGVAMCFGDNVDGSLGTGNTESKTTPVATVTFQTMAATTPSPGNTGGTTPSPPNAPPSPDSSDGGTIAIVVGCVVGGLIILGTAITIFVWRRRQKRNEATMPVTSNGAAWSTGSPTSSKGFSSPAVAAAPYHQTSPTYVQQQSFTPASTPNTSVPTTPATMSSVSALQSLPLTRPDESLFLSTLPRGTADNNNQVNSMRSADDAVLTWIASRQPAAERNALRPPAASRIPNHLQQMEFQWKDVEVYQSLGIGGPNSFGRVFLASVHRTDVALRLLVDTNAIESAHKTALPNASAASAASVTMASQEKLVDEINLLASLRHPNVVMLLGYCFEPPCLAVEYCACSSLRSVMERALTEPVIAQFLSWETRVSMLVQAAAGLTHLHHHSPAVVHRDIRSINLLLAADGTVKISDTGLAKLVTETTGTTTAGNGPSDPRYLAPEILRGEIYTTASDIYSFGVCMLELLTWQEPFAGFDNIWGVVRVIESGGRSPIPPFEQLPGLGPHVRRENVDRYVQLMQMCLAQEPSQRPTCDVVATYLRAIA